SITPAKRKTFVQTKLNFPVALDSPFTEKRLQDNSPPINIDIKQQHLKTSMHKENVKHEQANPSKKYCTTFLHFEKNQKETLNTEPYSEPSKKDDDLFGEKVKAHGYIQSKLCEGYTMSKYCSKCSILPQVESVQKRNQHYQELIAQIDCLFILKEGQSIPASFISYFGNTWMQYNINKLYELIIASLKNRPSKTKSTELEQLHKFIEKEIKDYSYYTTINKYSALGQIIESVETHGLENWIGQCMVYLINKTMEEKWPIFVGMAQAITKVIDKLQSTRWLTANLAGPTIRFLRYKRNEPDINYDIYGINISIFSDIIAMWHKAYNYNGPTVCAKDQTKVAELIEVCKHRQKWIGCVPIDDTTIPTTITIEELHNKVSSFKKQRNLIRPDNNDGYNIKLSTFKENLSKELSNFPSVFEIGNRMKEVSNAMKNIFHSLGIKIDQYFLLLIQQSIHSLKKNISYNILLEEISNDFNISTQEEIEDSDLLELDSNQLDDINELDTIDITTAICQDRLNNTEQQIRTKGRISQWKAACNKIFNLTKLNPQSLKFKNGDYYYYCENKNSIVIAEIIAVFEKYGSSYVHVDLLNSLNKGRIHARLYDLKSDFDQEFVPIINSNRAQFVKLGNLQYTTYFHFVEKSCKLEQSIKVAEKIMKAQKKII
ncbi:45671_t:CDS:2, partial [Gigaspora margarita]